jgi:ABC-2 type transport system permease protein
MRFIDLNVIYVLVMREFKKFARAKTRLLSSVARPLIWLFFIGAGMSRIVAPSEGVTYTQYIFPGILGMTILFSSIFSSISIIWDKEFGFMREILVAPVSRTSIVIGKAMSGTAVSTLQAVIILCLFPLLGLKLALANVVGVILICMLVSFCVSAFGIVLATFYDSYESFTVIMNFIIMPMFFLSGALYPVKHLPSVLRAASKLNPLTYGVDALKHLINPTVRGPMSPDFTLSVDLMVIAGMTLSFVAIASLVFERKK